MLIEIKPLDTLFFKDGRPFNVGDGNWAEGIFPPYPSVLYGAIRTTYFSGHMDEFMKVNRPDDPTRNLRIEKVYYKAKGTYYLPLPLDLVRLKNRDKQEIKHEEKYHEYNVLKLRYEENLRCSSNASLTGSLSYPDEVESLNGGLLLDADFEDYLNGCGKNYTVRCFKDYISIEDKIGIGINDTTRSSEEGMLYQIPMCRLKDLSICVEFDGLSIPSRGFMKLGGEGKPAVYERLDMGIKISTAKVGRYIKLYLLTPALFGNGWIPSWVDKDTFMGEYNGIKMLLHTAVIGKYNLIGGFDMRKRMPKPMRRAVPAGSVYYFEILNGNISEAIENFNGMAISEFDTAKEGFGVTFAGAWKAGDVL